VLLSSYAKLYEKKHPELEYQWPLFTFTDLSKSSATIYLEGKDGSKVEGL
jgi:hypothetical protein